MAAGQLDSVVRRLREVTSRQAVGERTDVELLREFVHTGNESAFTALVHRHGPLVLGVCRRVLRNRADAEDCFQATFLVLVRKARSLRRPESLANWLYGVACRVARKARVVAARRRAKEALAMPRAETTNDATDDLLVALDQELAALPENYRVPLVRCDLGGETRREVARDLGCAEGTVASRLARGRVLLARRLSRHLPGLGGGALAALLAENGKACVPASLVSLTVRAAAGQTASANVLALTEGVLKVMFLNKLKAVVLILMVGVLATATGVLAVGGPRPRDEPSDPSRPAPAKEARISDAEFIRRACLDIRGSLPTDIEVHYFLQDTNPKKRAWIVGKLKEEAALQGEGRKTAQPGEDRHQAGMKRLEGTWKVSRLVMQGQEVPPGQFHTAEVSFQGGKVRFRLERKGQDEQPASEFSFRLHPAQPYQAIDFIPREGPLTGKTLRGIYEVTGNTLRLCFSDQPDRVRPTEFRVPAGSNLYLVTARRARTASPGQ
jgi:RNA polymerase sigma factor (sigma-70 family)